MLLWVLPQVLGKHLQRSHVAVPAPWASFKVVPLSLHFCLVFQWETSIAKVEEFQGAAAALLG